MGSLNSVEDLQRALDAAQREVQRLQAALAQAASHAHGAGDSGPALEKIVLPTTPGEPLDPNTLLGESVPADAPETAWSPATLEAIPLAMWVLSFSALRPRIEELRRLGISRFEDYFQSHPEETHALAARVKLLGYNRLALHLLQGEGQGGLVRHLPAYLRDESWPAIGKVLAGVAHRAASVQVELPLWTLSGQQRYVLWCQAGPAPGEPDCHSVLVALVDITSRKQNELALQQSEERFRRLVESAHHVTYCYTLQPEPRMVYVSPSATEMTGYTPEEHYQNAGLAEAALLDPEDLAALEQALLLGGNFYRPIEVRLKHRSGRTVWTEQVHVPVYDESGELIGLEGIALDVTERKEAEAALRASEQRYRSLLETLQEGIWVVDAHARTTFVNPRMAEMLGYRAEEMLGQPVATFLEPGTDASANPLQSPQGRTHAFELELVRKDGSKVATLVRSSPLYDSQGNYTGTLAGVADITRRKQAEEALRRSEERYRGLVNALPVVIYSALPDAGLTLRFLSPQWEALTGFSCQQCLSDPQFRLSLIHPEDRQAVQDRVELLRERKIAVEVEYRLRSRDGGFKWVRDRAVPAFDLRGQLAGYDGFLEDITQRRRQEEQLHHMQVQLAHAWRLATLGEMVAGLAHEVSQPLFSILNYATACTHLLSQQRADVELLGQWNREIAGEAARAGEILRRLRTFARRAEPECLVRDLHEVVEESVALVAAEARTRRISIEKRLAGGPLSARFDRVEIQQVLVNLLRNAFEALDAVPVAGRRVVIETAAQGPWARVAVADNGPGVPPSLVSQIFEPFMTTKPDGMGMGLAISRTLIEAHGGTLSYTPAEGGGAKFYFCLPLATGKR